MRFRQQLFVTLLIQGLGAAAVFGATLILGLSIGPEEQGVFSKVKSEIEFVTALALFGMPQAVFYFLNAGRLPLQTAIRISIVVGIATVGIAIVYMLAASQKNWLFITIFSIASGIIAVHGILRVIILALSSQKLFNICTALPQIILLILVSCLALMGIMQEWMTPAIFLTAFLGTCFLIWPTFNSNRNNLIEQKSPMVRRKELVQFGTAAWCVASLGSASIVFWLNQIEQSLGLVSVGIFTMGMTLLQVSLTPFNYASPLLFKRWMDSPARPKIFWPAILIGVGSFLAVSLALSIIELIPISESLANYRALGELKLFFTITAAAEISMRITAVASNASGHPWIPAFAELARLLSLNIAILIGLTDSLHLMTVSWTISTLVAATVMLGAIQVSERRDK